MKRYFTLAYWKGQRLLLLAFLLLHVIISSIYITWQNTTFDEKDYYGYSIRWLHGKVNRDNKMYDSKTPVVAIAAVPRMIQQVADPTYKATDNGNKDIHNGRIMMVVFTIIIALYLFKWMRLLFPDFAWVIPLLLFLFDPMVLGFSMIITSDMAAGACLLATCYHLYRYYLQRTTKQLASFSIWMSVGFVCKASLLYFLPYLFIVFLLLLMTGKIKFSLQKTLSRGLIILATILLVMNLSYFGKDSFRPLKRSSFQSTTFQKLAATPIIRDIPVPIPFSYIQGLDMLQFHGEIGAGHLESTHHGTFIDGKARYKGGFWYYYLYVGMYKIPVPTLILILAGIFVIAFSGYRQLFYKHIWYLFPFIFFFLILSCFNPFQNGFRHFLLIYPLCFLIIAAGIAKIQQHIRYGKLIITGLFVHAIISTALYFPWLISYTNELMDDKKLVFHKLIDSSIDYGQNAVQLEKFKKTNLEYSTPPSIPAPGKYIVSAYQLIDYKHRQNASWLTAYTPLQHYQYSMFLFDISPSQLNNEKSESRQMPAF